MIKIYFDNSLIDNDSYLNLKNSYKLYTNKFNLGSTSANEFNVSILKEFVSTVPTNVKITDNDVDLAYLHVDSMTETKGEYQYVLTDAMTLMNFDYDASAIFVNNQTTLLAIAQDICTKVGIQLGTTDFRGYNKTITWYDNTKTARDYIGYIAELNGGYAQIGHDGKLYFKKQNTQSVKTIDVDECEDFNLGQRHQITRVVFEQGSLKYEFGTTTGDTLYLSSENVYITEESEVEEIFEEINGFTYYSIDCGKTPIDSSILSGSIIEFSNLDDSYKTIACYDIAYYGNWTGSYSLDDIESTIVAETQNKGTSQKIKAISITVDRLNNEVTQVVREVDDYDERINSVELKQTATDYKIEVISTTDEDGNITGVKTSNGYTFDKDGLKIYKDNESFNALFNNTGSYYKDGETIVSQTTKDGTITKDLILYGTYYYGVEDGLSVENFEKNDAMFVAELFTDENGEECVGHFYNR